MFRIVLIILTLIPSLFLIFNTPASAFETDADPCLTCHIDTYTKAITNRFPHSVIERGCTICHYLEAAKETKPKIISRTFQKKAVFSITKFLNPYKDYEIMIKAVDVDGNKANAFVTRADAKQTLNRSEHSFSIHEITNIDTIHMREGSGQKAAISWETDVPSIAEIEYGIYGGAKTRLKLKAPFSRKHNAVLKGLEHNNKYSFKIISKDLNGNRIESEEYRFNNNTGSIPVQCSNNTKTLKPVIPVIENTMLFSIGKRTNLFIRLSANKPVKFRISIYEVKPKSDRPCDGFTQTKSSTIKICLKCHPHDVSHPVGVRSPDHAVNYAGELPMIEDGIITCVTCHLAHGGENDYYLRTTSIRTMCVKCHLGHSDKPLEQGLNR